jgi:MoxR-like ATPase
VGKSEIINAAFKQVNPGNRGLKTVILSQIGALDTYGMPHINDAGTTEFTPTATFGRGQKHLFLDEMNNATPLVQGAVQNLLSAKVMGDDSYQDVFLIAACNPPSTNSLAKKEKSVKSAKNAKELLKVNQGGLISHLD